MTIRSLLLPALLFLGACAPAAAPRAEPAARIAHPGLWKLADEDTTIYLFGTIHVLPRDYAWESPTLKDAVARADELVIETVIGRDPQAIAQMLLTMGRATGLPPLSDRVPAEKKAALAELIARSKLPPQLLDGMKTWTAAMMLVASTLTDIGLEPGSGVEEQLKTSFAANQRPISGLEKPEQQLGYLDSLSETDQRVFLASVVEDPEKNRTEFADMLAAWSRGDEQAIARTFDDVENMTPLLRTVLLERRNVLWSAWLAERLEKPGTVLVAVGAGHLAGRDSVQAKLKAQGLKVTRVE
ncbi:MAG: GumN family protein [Sphingomonas bacterium]|nr:GumN family protein [Sphingomonas bacterium]